MYFKLSNAILGLLLCFEPQTYANTDVLTYRAEDGPHEATWLQWPHNYGWDPEHVERYEDSWIELTKALHTGEKVRIIVYDSIEHDRVYRRLESLGLNMKQIEFYEYQTDDVWVRDNGPMFVFDQRGDMIIEDWGFNGWGWKADSAKDDVIPAYISYDLNIPYELVNMVNEGGSIEVDGKGTLMAKKSSIYNPNRNPRLDLADIEDYFSGYLGVTNFIWLDGVITPEDITDDHIDGTARFANGNTIVTHAKEDMTNPAEYDILNAATDVNGKKYNIVTLPLTQNRVSENIQNGLDDYGLYMNYYVGNDVVIIPKYNDPNDEVAARILKEVYPKKQMVLIDFNELYKDGGIVHCVTKEQPSL